MTSLHLEPIRFSIVSPSYKQLDFLSLAVSSVRDQTQRGNSNPTFPVVVEHIIQDPGTPGLDEFAKRHCATYNEILPCTNIPDQSKDHHSLYIYKEKDEGMYDAINRGFKKASGEIFAYLNCDEQYLPGTLEKVAVFFRDHPHVDMVFGDALLTDSNGRAFSYRKATLPTLWHTQLCHLGTLTCATFFRKSLWTKGVVFDPNWKAIGDAVWIEKCLRLKVQMATIDSPLATFSFTGTNLSETQGTGGDSEHRRWSKTLKGAPSWMRIPVSCAHRIRKLLAGAYKRRNIAYSIYTFNSPEKREELSASDIGSDWPRPANIS